MKRGKSRDPVNGGFTVQVKTQAQSKKPDPGLRCQYSLSKSLLVNNKKFLRVRKFLKDLKSATIEGQKVRVTFKALIYNTWTHHKHALEFSQLRV